MLKSKKQIIIISSVSLLLAGILAGIVDYYINYQLASILFYIIPIFLFSYQNKISQKYIILFCLVAGLEWSLVNFITHPYSNEIFILWNAISRFAVFMLISVILKRLITDKERKQIITEQKQNSEGIKNESEQISEQIINDYKNKKTLFEEFNVVVFRLLQNILEQENYKYQITYRTKTIDSLREKLTRKPFKNLQDIYDLAGVRIIFYFESDTDKFIKEINQEISDQLIIDNKNKPSGYTAKHVIVSLGPERLILKEYKKFEKLKCEIQLTSILHHVWAEIEHDLIYKNINPNHKKYIEIKRHLNNVLKKHILKASSEIERIARLINK